VGQPLEIRLESLWIVSFGRYFLDVGPLKLSHL
jgi:hypothetical protein